MVVAATPAVEASTTTTVTPDEKPPSRMIAAASGEAAKTAFPTGASRTSPAPVETTNAVG